MTDYLYLYDNTRGDKAVKWFLGGVTSLVIEETEEEEIFKMEVASYLKDVHDILLASGFFFEKSQVAYPLMASRKFDMEILSFSEKPDKPLSLRSSESLRRYGVKSISPVVPEENTVKLEFWRQK